MDIRTGVRYRVSLVDGASFVGEYVERFGEVVADPEAGSRWTKDDGTTVDVLDDDLSDVEAL